MAAWWAAGTTLLGLWGASKSAGAAADQIKFQNEAREAQYKYDVERYNMTADKIKADHAFAVLETNAKRRNERRTANWKDATAKANYMHQLAIRNREQASLEAQFDKSNVLYDQQIGFNEKVAAHAEENEWRKLDEINAEASFEAQDQRLKHLVEEGQIRAKGQSGRSVAKTHQSIAANFGQNIAALNEGLAGAGRNTAAMIEEIKNDQFSANLAAFANKMLDPGQLPMPVIPFKTPEAEFLDPMPLQDFHFGPEPIKAAMASESAAANAVWGSAIPSIASNAISIYKMMS
jgi:hypothetical protein